MVYLISEKTSGVEYIEIEFKSARCARSAATDCTPAISIYPNTKDAVSYVVELTQSNWLTEAHGSYLYQGTPPLTEHKHYVISNHDVFHEVIAKSFEERIVSRESAIYLYLQQSLQA